MPNSSTPQEEATSPPQGRRFTVAWSWLGLAFSFSDRKFIISRKRAFGGIHLTISYRNASGDLDMHLKRESVAPGEDPYTPLARVSKERLKHAGERINVIGERIAESMLAHWRSVRPGWLERQGYLLTILPKEPSAEMLRDILQPFAPRRYHGKHQLTFEPLKDPAYWAKLSENLYYAGIIRDLDPDTVQLPIHGTSMKRGCAPLQIASFNIEGYPEWFMSSEHRLREGIARAMAEFMIWLGDSIGDEHPVIFRRIVDELGLEEIPELSDFIREALDFLSSPRDAVAKAQRAAEAWTPTVRLHPASLAARLKARRR
jgi:hypothetical protein